jgi:hypothetical protein
VGGEVDLPEAYVRPYLLRRLAQDGIPPSEAARMDPRDVYAIVRLQNAEAQFVREEEARRGQGR